MHEEKEKNNKKRLLIVLLLLFICLSGFLIYKIGFEFGKRQRAIAIDPTPETTFIEIKDNYGVWTENGVANETIIFSQDVKAKKYVAPFDEGVYKFEVVNKTKKSSILYRLYLEEINKDKVNIKYKLKKNGKYVIGEDNWVYYDKVELTEQLLAFGDADEYELEWSWVSEDDVLDTKIGTKAGRANYKLTINVIATEDLGR